MSSNGTSETPPASIWVRLSLSQIALGTAVFALVVLGLGLLIALRYVLLLLFLAIVVATALNPLAERLRRLNFSASLAALVTYTLLVLVVSGVLALLVPFFILQVVDIAADLPERYANLRNTMQGASSGLVRSIANQLPANPFAQITTTEGIALGAGIAALLPSFGRGILFGALVLFLSYYWLYYRALAIQSLAMLVPIDRRVEIVELWNQIETKLGAFVRGLAVLSLTIGALSAVGYSLIGLPYALSIAVIAGLLEAIPYVGPLVTMVLTVVVGVSVSPTTALLALGVSLLIQLLENNIVVPRIMGRAVGVSPVVTLLAIALFTQLFGLLGALLAVPLAAVFQVLIDRFMLTPPPAEQADIGGRDKLALLRYQARDLAHDLRQQLRSKTEDVDADGDVVEEELEALLVDLDGLLATAQEQQA